jgi:hypothetical protein
MTKKPAKKIAKKLARKAMTEAQVNEIEDLENLEANYRHERSNLACDVKEAEKALKVRDRDLARAEKNCTRVTSKLQKLRTKYKGWKRPKPAKASADEQASLGDVSAPMAGAQATLSGDAGYEGVL